ALETAGESIGIGIRQLAVMAIRHHGCEDAPVRTFASAYRIDNIIRAPGADPGFAIWRQIGRVEDSEAWNLEADVGAREIALRVRLAEKHAGRVASAAIHDRGEILAAAQRV